MPKIYPLAIVCLLLSFSLESLSIKGPHFVSLGPEIYYLKRKKEGGSFQDGMLYGVHGTYERLRHCGFYWAADGYYATGCIEGETKSGKPLKSNLTDSQIEGRLGYSLCYSFCPKLRLIPYAGYGYFRSVNDFKKPSPLLLKFTDEFQYVAGGAMLIIDINPNWDAGVHYKYKYPWEPKCRVSRDPENETLTLNVGTEYQYEIEIPIRYHRCWKGRNIGITLAPFHRFTHYGAQANFPSDVIDTRFRIWGARCMLRAAF
jgi:hypothetical protein